MSRYARRVDANQSVIVAALRQVGCEVTVMSAAGHGMSDLVVTRAGLNYLIETKTAKGKLTPAQIKFHAKHHVQIARTRIQALEAVGLIGYGG